MKLSRKLLFFQWNAFMQNDIERILRKMPEIELSCVSYEFRNPDRDDYFLTRFPKELTREKYDAVFSLNFFPLVSDLCQKLNIPYISWVYDAPMNIRKLDSLGNPVNRIYVFDRGQFEDLRRKGFTTIHHKPLGVDTYKSEKLSAEVLCDISFVGKIYSSSMDYIYSFMPSAEKARIEMAIEEQRHIYGEYILDDFLTQNYIESLNSTLNGLQITKEELEFAMASEITRRERIEVLSMLGRKHDLVLYSYNLPKELEGLKCMGTANYYTEMPGIFAGSRINLNISLKIIKSGIPLRALDIMGAGGFLLSNYQKELAENYTDGKEILMYRSISELAGIADYYLTHDEERKQIAKAGHLRTRELFELEKMLQELLL